MEIITFDDKHRLQVLARAYDIILEYEKAESIPRSSTKFRSTSCFKVVSRPRMLNSYHMLRYRLEKMKLFIEMIERMSKPRYMVNLKSLVAKYRMLPDRMFQIIDLRTAVPDDFLVIFYFNKSSIYVERVNAPKALDYRNKLVEKLIDMIELLQNAQHPISDVDDFMRRLLKRYLNSPLYEKYFSIINNY